LIVFISVLVVSTALSRIAYNAPRLGAAAAAPPFGRAANFRNLPHARRDIAAVAPNRSLPAADFCHYYTVFSLSYVFFDYVTNFSKNHNLLLK
jgi:hypothetical protein